MRRSILGTKLSLAEIMWIIRAALERLSILTFPIVPQTSGRSQYTGLSYFDIHSQSHSRCPLI